jgi:hypothetical protein
VVESRRIPQMINVSSSVVEEVVKAGLDPQKPRDIRRPPLSSISSTRKPPISAPSRKPIQRRIPPLHVLVTGECVRYPACSQWKPSRGRPPMPKERKWPEWCWMTRGIFEHVRLVRQLSSPFKGVLSGGLPLRKGAQEQRRRQSNHFRFGQGWSGECLRRMRRLARMVLTVTRSHRNRHQTKTILDLP